MPKQKEKEMMEALPLMEVSSSAKSLLLFSFFSFFNLNFRRGSI